MAEFHLIDTFELPFAPRSLQRYNYTAWKIRVLLAANGD